MADGRPNVGLMQPESAGDNLRVYLKEMGSVPLLTRQAEIVLARKMERGQRRVVGSLAQCSAVEGELRLLDEQIRLKCLAPGAYFESDGNLSKKRLRKLKPRLKKLRQK